MNTIKLALVASSILAFVGFARADVDLKAKTLFVEQSGGSWYVTGRVLVWDDVSPGSYQLAVKVEQKRNGQVIATPIDETWNGGTSGQSTCSHECKAQSCTGTCTVDSKPGDCSVAIANCDQTDGKNKCGCTKKSGRALVEIQVGDILVMTAYPIGTSDLLPDDNTMSIQIN